MKLTKILFLIVGIIVMLILLLFVYLALLNNRYTKITDYAILDKWTGKTSVTSSKR